MACSAQVNVTGSEAWLACHLERVLVASEVLLPSSLELLR